MYLKAEWKRFGFCGHGGCVGGMGGQLWGV